jgi:hypothetical protein
MNSYKKTKELIFKPPYKLNDIKQLMVYKFDNNKLLKDNILQNQEIQQQIEKNKQYIKDNSNIQN